MEDAQIYINSLTTSIIPKLLSSIQDTEKRKYVKFHLESKLPSKSLGYKTNEEFLTDNNLNKSDIIQNSIKYSLKNINDEDLLYLSQEFINLSINYKIFILNNDTNSAIYLEIINILEYIKKIQSIFTKALKRSDYLGTANRNSSFEKRVKTELSKLEERLENPYFPIKNAKEKDKIIFQVKVIKSVLEKNKNIIELLNYHKILFGLATDINDFTDIEIVGLEELLNFFNGLQTNTYKLLNSVFLYLNIHSNPSLSLLSNDYQDSVYNIVLFFFDSEITEYDKTHSRTITFSKSKMQQPYTISTILFDIPIYTTLQKDNGILEYFIEESLKDIYGLKNIFDDSKPSEDEQTQFQQLRSLAYFKKVMGFDKKDIEALSYLMPLLYQNQLEGNLPLL